MREGFLGSVIGRADRVNPAARLDTDTDPGGPGNCRREATTELEGSRGRR